MPEAKTKTMFFVEIRRGAGVQNKLFYFFKIV
jgi:hypothetical protein